MFCGIIGFRSYTHAVTAAIRSTTTRVDTEAEQRLLAAKARVDQMVKELQYTSRTAIDERIAALEKVYERRQGKYLKLLRDYFSTVFEANADLKRVFLGNQFDEGAFRGKRILWVEDDPVGIALLVQLLECCGLKIQIRGSTEAALAESLAEYDLLISNLRRDPDDNAGLLLAQAIRQRQSRLPIIIFTRPERMDYYRESIERAGASLVASQNALFARVAQELSPGTEGLIVNAVGQS
jgi:CheY-like chemotaxis protein